MTEQKQVRTTYPPEYIKERESIDRLAASMQNQILQLNKRLDLIQITDFKILLSEPTEMAKKHRKWWQFWKAPFWMWFRK